MIFGPDPGHGGLRFVVVFSEGVEVRASDMAALSETTGARALKIDFDPGSVTTGDPAQLRIYMEIPSDA